MPYNRMFELKINNNPFDLVPEPSSYVAGTCDALGVRLYQAG